MSDAYAAYVENRINICDNCGDPARARTVDIGNGRTLQLCKNCEELSVARRRRSDIHERDVKLFNTKYGE